MGSHRASGLQSSRPVGERPVSWKGLGEQVLRDAGVEEIDGTVYVPYRGADGCPLFAKCFRYARSWIEPAGVEVVPYGLELLPASPWIAERSMLLITEGESDALAMREHLVGAFALALPGAGTWRTEWMRYLRPFLTIYVLGDGDEPGRRMNDRVAQDCRWARRVRLPDGQDVRGILQRDGRRGLLPYLEAADYDALLKSALRASDGDVTRFEQLVREGLA